MTFPTPKNRRTGLAVAAILAVSGLVPLAASAADISTHDDDAESQMIVTADFNGDGIADTARIVSDDGETRVILSLGRPDGSMQTQTTEKIPSKDPRSVIVGDFNQDGKPDIVVADENGTVLLLLGDGKGNISEVRDVAHYDSAISVAVADFNRDGKPDLAISDWRSSTITVLIGTGSGQFRQGWSFPMRMRGTTPQLSAADFNGDGIPDIVVIYGDDDEYTYDVMLGDGQGTFVRSTELSTAIDPNAHCPT